MRPTQVDVAFAHVVPGMSETPVDSPTSISTEEATKAMEDPATPRIPDLQQAAKRVYFIRHAESEWNSGAKRGPMGILRALMKIDHPLTKKGYSQAAALQQALRDQPPDDLAGVLSAEAIWTSPQTRAVQTALVALLPSLEKEDATAAVTLCPSVRERRNGAYSRDNVGGGVGEALRSLACDRLARLKADGVDSMRKAAERFDMAEVQSKWWTARKEPASAVSARASALLGAMLDSEHSAFVVVSHSQFLRRLLAEHLPDDGCGENGPSGMARAMRKAKLPNCGVVCCTLEMEGEKPVLREAKVCWPADGAEMMLRKTKAAASAKVAPAPPPAKEIYTDAKADSK